MAYFDFAVDCGTSKTTIYQKDTGVVLREATCAVLCGEELRYAGDPAKKLIGKIPDGYEICFPVFEGNVVAERPAGALLALYFGRLLPQTIFKPKLRTIFTLPCGATKADRKSLDNAAYAAGVRDAYYLQAAVATSVGLSLHESGAARMLVDIGGGKTDVSVVAHGEIIAGCTLSIGGNLIDTSIVDTVLEHYDLKIGLLTAERTKQVIGSLYEGDGSTVMVSGTDAYSGAARSMLLSAKNLFPLLAGYCEKIFEVIKAMATSLPADVSAEVLQSEVYLVGESAKIAGLAPYFRRKMNLNAVVPPAPELVTAAGAGKILDDGKLFKKVFDL